MTTINKAQALLCHYGQELHYTGQHDCTRTIGPRGGETVNVTRVRVSGKCKTWKSRPDEFRLPVKYGLYESAAVTHENSQHFHLACYCPLNAG